jgi:hypothetical protein
VSLADRLLLPFKRVQTRGGTVTPTDLAEMQGRLEQSIAGMQAMIRTLAPVGVCVDAELTAAQVALYFDDTGLGRPSHPYVGWAIRNGKNSTRDAGGKFARWSTSAAGATGGSDSSAHTHDAGTLATRFAMDGSHAFGVAATTFFTATQQKAVPNAWAAGSWGGIGAPPVFGSTGAPDATDNRPAFLEVVPLQRVA